MCNRYIHFHFRGRGRFLWFVWQLACWETKPKISDPCAKIAAILPIWSRGCLSSLSSWESKCCDFNSSFVYLCSPVYNAVWPVIPTCPNRQLSSDCLSLICFSNIISCLWPFTVSPRESSAGSFSLRGNSCKSWAVTRCQTWMNTRPQHTSEHGGGKKMQNTTLWFYGQSLWDMSILFRRPTLEWVSLRWAWRRCDTHSFWTEPSCG